MVQIALHNNRIWQNAGWNSIIYIAALSGIDPQLYEAAYVDGANKIKQIWYVSLPNTANYYNYAYSSLGKYSLSRMKRLYLCIILLHMKLQM